VAPLGGLVPWTLPWGRKKATSYAIKSPLMARGSSNCKRALTALFDPIGPRVEDRIDKTNSDAGVTVASAHAIRLLSLG